MASFWGYGGSNHTQAPEPNGNLDVPDALNTLAAQPRRPPAATDSEPPAELRLEPSEGVSLTPQCSGELFTVRQPSAEAAAAPSLPPTAQALDVPLAHDGQSVVFTFELRFSKQIPLSYRTPSNSTNRLPAGCAECSRVCT